MELERIATALERIAELMELLTVEPAAEPQTTEVIPCPHPEDQRMALGATNGWICLACQHRENPS